MIIIYGAYGFTGRLIARAASERGLECVLAGRSEERLEPLAQEVGARFAAVALDDGEGLERLLADATAVIHCAGPFVHTWKAMAQACLETGTHYLDITGEAGVFAALAELGGKAQAQGITLLPGVGFDVVPTDCLAAHLASRLPEATHLRLAFQGGSRPSRGTATTMVEHAHRGGLIRRDGELTSIPMGSRTREVDFGEGPIHTVAIPWGDVVTAWYSTGIPNIEVFMAASPRAVARLRRMGWVRPLLGLRPVKALLMRRVRAAPEGPSARALEGGRSRVWGEVADAEGTRREARLFGPNGYRWTAITAVAAAERTVRGQLPPGFQTPSRAFGADFVLESGGAEREDL